MSAAKTPKPRKPGNPNLETHFKIYQGTRMQLRPSLEKIQCILVNKDHPCYGQPPGIFIADSQGGRVDGFNQASLTWEMIDQLILWRSEMLKWKDLMKQWCIDNGVTFQDSEE